MKFNLNDRPGFFPMLMYGLQWWIVSIPCVVIIGIIVARLHYTDQVEQIFYMQKLFGIMGLAMIVQMLWGHRLPLVIGPASVLLIGILSTVSIGVEGIYTSLMIGGGILTLLAFSGLLSRLQAVFTPRIIVVILCLIAFTLSPVILRLIFAGNSSVLFHLFFALLLALAMILANKLLKGIWKSIVVLGGILVGSMVYYSDMGFPETGGIQAGHEGYFGLWPWKFDLGAVLSFLFCFIALIVNELGSIQAVGRMIGADRMERRTTRGVGVTGLANVVSDCRTGRLFYESGDYRCNRLCFPFPADTGRYRIGRLCIFPGFYRMSECHSRSGYGGGFALSDGFAVVGRYANDDPGKGGRRFRRRACGRVFIDGRFIIIFCSRRSIE